MRLRYPDNTLSLKVRRKRKRRSRIKTILTVNDTSGLTDDELPSEVQV
jgi:hypothetical protein